jgi:hypothetical protein
MTHSFSLEGDGSTAAFAKALKAMRRVWAPLERPKRTKQSIHQQDFMRAMTLLLMWIHSNEGYGCTPGDMRSKPGNEPKHSANSFHYKGLAFDICLFYQGKYLRSTEDHRFVGEYWKTLGGTWGGDFRKKDGNHYSHGEGTR